MGMELGIDTAPSSTLAAEVVPQRMAGLLIVHQGFEKQFCIICGEHLVSMWAFTQERLWLVMMVY
jgi:hypothetical protein